MFLKNRDLVDCSILYELIVDPDVFSFVRQKPNSYDEFVFLTKQTIEAEDRGELISRTIVDDRGMPIGVINLFDLNNHTGFLGTWIGKPYFGKGYNQQAKVLFFDELFFTKQIETIFMQIRKTNTRSLRAAKKLPYCVFAYEYVKDGVPFYVFRIDKEMYESARAHDGINLAIGAIEA